MAHAARRRFLRSILLGAVAGMAISGCGQKGPLYLPEDELEKKKKEKTSKRSAESPVHA
ncbi:MAG: lipoprotein [Gammaproteobacteria bacterium]|nr:lipoprotein [Gammaproteobacteria bacterium]